MPKTIEVPYSLIKKLTKATKAFVELEDELEDYLLSTNSELIAKMRWARAQHLRGDTAPLSKLKSKQCIE